MPFPGFPRQSTFPPDRPPICTAPHLVSDWQGDDSVRGRRRWGGGGAAEADVAAHAPQGQELRALRVSSQGGDAVRDAGPDDLMRGSRRGRLRRMLVTATCERIRLDVFIGEAQQSHRSIPAAHCQARHESRRSIPCGSIRQAVGMPTQAVEPPRHLLHGRGAVVRQAIASIAMNT